MVRLLSRNDCLQNKKTITYDGRLKEVTYNEREPVIALKIYQILTMRNIIKEEKLGFPKCYEEINLEIAPHILELWWRIQINEDQFTLTLRGF
jgi:hypothetical protein